MMHKCLADKRMQRGRKRALILEGLRCQLLGLLHHLFAAIAANESGTT